MVFNATFNIISGYSVDDNGEPEEVITLTITGIKIGLGLWCLMPLSTIFQ
jgi:hypothetical protein